MNTSKGTFRMIYESALCFMGKFFLLYITLPLFIAWIILGFYVDLQGANVVSAISGPFYFCIPYLAIAGFHSLFPVAIGMGSIRVQFLKSFYAVGAAGILACLFLINIGQYWLVKTSHTILHPGIFLIPEYHFLSYLWLDLIFGFFLFGIALLCYAVWYRLGTVKTALLFVGVTIVGMFLVYGGVLSAWTVLAETNGWILAVLLTFISLLLLFSTYPLMKNASLYPRSVIE